MDVADSDQVEALRDESPPPTAPSTCSATTPVWAPRPNISSTPALWRWVTGVNLLGVAYGVSAFAPLMVEQGEATS